MSEGSYNPCEDLNNPAAKVLTEGWHGQLNFRPYSGQCFKIAIKCERNNREEMLIDDILDCGNNFFGLKSGSSKTIE